MTKVNIKSVHLKVINMQLKQPFMTHLESVTDREAIIIEVGS
ncbi:hypothetical protein [Mesobacillus subterraneus]|uniref:Uncharacterized protein n=1 Tax=Mesobacillus stamsii TaxID=225347 RepID=A0ABU0FT59_9BACI|nr:hypothetical protein [Mesobacillus stamsii]